MGKGEGEVKGSIRKDTRKKSRTGEGKEHLVTDKNIFKNSVSKTVVSYTTLISHLRN